MDWIIFALLAALATGFNDALSKFLLQKDDVFVVAWMRVVFLAPVLLLGLFLFWPFNVTPGFWLVLVFLIPVDVLAFVLYLQAIRQSPLSLTLPFLSLTPVFAIFTSRLILGEKIGGVGLAGIGLIVLGSYLLNIKEIRRGWGAPFAAIGKEAGCWLMIAVAFLYGLSIVLGKEMILLSEPAFMALVYPLVLFFCLMPMVIYRVRKKICRFDLKFDRFLLYFLTSFLFAVIVVGHFKSVTLTFAAYAISVKRTSILVGSVLGFLFFKEKQVLPRILGIGLMLAGVFVVGFYA
jgi:drug/metabolite transporter (DMT)-like permease